MENPNTPTPSGMTPGAASAGSGQTLRNAPLEALLHELMKRESAGECVALVVTPSDLSEFWECDESGATNPASAVPTLGEMRAIQKAFGRWQDTGGFTEVMQVCRDAWNTAKEDASK